MVLGVTAPPVVVPDGVLLGAVVFPCWLSPVAGGVAVTCGLLLGVAVLPGIHWFPPPAGGVFSGSLPPGVGDGVFPGDITPPVVIEPPVVVPIVPPVTAVACILFCPLFAAADVSGLPDAKAGTGVIEIINAADNAYAIRGFGKFILINFLIYNISVLY